MSTIGESLRNARKARGISLEQAEEDTKIRKRYLQALEEGDYDAIPGRVYAKGFLRNYARFLGLNEEEIMLEYKLLGTPARDNFNKENFENTLSKRKLNRSGRKTYMITVIVAVLAVITLGVYGYIFSNKPEVDKEGGKGPGTEQTDNENKLNDQNQGQNQNGAGEPGTEPGNVPENGGGSPANESPGGSDTPVHDQAGVKVVLDGIAEKCWARVTVDGTVIFEGDINPGDSKSFAGESLIRVRLGSAGAVEVTVNGEKVGVLGRMGEVITRDFTPAGN
ncbi:MAG: hypothetical protein CVU89_07155 [Firmicutes bacterium HGW-Firmicutes-14]|nr:MAG: hypothetical protein CVU89_07155 [Firmicutes bacterium HGW-Firmicutes-14]